MSKVESKTFVPELRFPEFLNGGSWENKLLGECLLGKPEYGINAPAVPYSHELPTYLRITDILENGQISQDNKVSVERDVIAKNYLDVGDIVLARTGASVGKSYKYREKDGKLVFAGFLIRIKPDERKLNSELLFQYLFTDQYWKWVSVNSARSGQPGINGNEYSLLSIPVPTQIEEQQKVADCLSSMDDLIAENAKKLDLLKLHKKGLMQKLFPEEGKSIPEFGFACNVKWIKKTFEEVYSLKTTNSLSRDKLNYDEGLVKNIHYGDIHTKFSTLFDITKEYVPFISEEISLDKIKQESYCQEGDMVFADASEDIDDVGKSIELININGEKLLSGLHTILARQKENYLVKGFGGYLFKSEVMRNQIQKESQGAKVLGISSGRISKIDVIFPIKQSEQQRIVDCLSSLDKLIDAQTKKMKY
ncbi:restriction endonuclease subunit S [Vibrio parahaemolyticus]|nr:restriction endonuclease subunit S [Vibrio parahaemolyticus]